MTLIIIIIVLLLLFGGGGGYYAHRSYGARGLGGQHERRAISRGEARPARLAAGR